MSGTSCQVIAIHEEKNALRNAVRVLRVLIKTNSRVHNLTRAAQCLCMMEPYTKLNPACVLQSYILTVLAEESFREPSVSAEIHYFEAYRARLRADGAMSPST